MIKSLKKVKKQRAERETGSERFDQHFLSIYQDRWPGLKAALLSSQEKFELKNPFGESRFKAYSLNPASLAPTRQLDLQPQDFMADFCSSPGGKLLSAIFQIQGQGRFFASDLSAARIAKLKAILRECLPEEILSQIEVHHGDASRLGQNYPGHFDKVLVDAPCSGERHLLESKKELDRWTLKGSQRLQVRQNALLCSAVDATRPGGIVVYSTCSISPIENDDVIKRLEKSRAGKFSVVPISEPAGERTEKGWIYLPDVTGSGPIYLSKLQVL